MSFVCCQIDLAVKKFFSFCSVKMPTLFTAPPPIEAGLDDLLRIYNQGHNQSGVPLCMPNAALKKTGMEIILFTLNKVSNSLLP